MAHDTERHADEWRTAREALRCLLDLEREHASRIRAVRAAWRAELLATMARERAALLSAMLDLDPAALSGTPVAGDWTCKDLLAHVAAWDEFVTARIELVLAGRAAEIARVETRERNAELYPERKDWPLERALAAADGARRALLAALARVPDEELHRARRFAWGEASIRRWAELRFKHDAEHRLELEAWREALNPPEGVSPRPLLLAALRASRDELLALAARVPPSERETRLLAGEWTLKDICGHLADWETQCTHAIADMLAGRSPEVAFVDDEEIWNRGQAEARRAQPWEIVWRDLHAARAELLAVIEAATLEDLARIIPSYWTDQDSAYAWARFAVKHERAHMDLGEQAGSRGTPGGTPGEQSGPPPAVAAGSLVKRRRILPHWQTGGSVYFVTFSTQGIQLPDAARSIVLDACRFWHRTRIRLHIVCVMPDHVHALMEPLEAAPGQYHDLSRILQSIKNYSAHEVDKLLDRRGALWEEESWDRIVRDETEYREKWRYIENNPVKAGLVDEPWDYPWLWAPED